MWGRQVLAVGILAAACNTCTTVSVSAAYVGNHNPQAHWRWQRVKTAGKTGLRLRGGGPGPEEVSHTSQDTSGLDVEPPLEVNGLCYGPKCKIPELQGIFPLPPISLFRPSEEYLTSVAAQQPEVINVPNRGTTVQACLFTGRRLNPAAFPEGVFINERRALLTGRFDFRTDEPGSIGGIMQDDGEKFYRRGVACLKRLEFLNIDWCNRARYKDHMSIASRVFGIWTTMTNKIIRETSEETRDYARTTLTLAMTRNHILAGEEQLALHWVSNASSLPSINAPECCAPTLNLSLPHALHTTPSLPLPLWCLCSCVLHLQKLRAAPASYLKPSLLPAPWGRYMMCARRALWCA